MMHGTLTLATFVSAMIFPWPLTMVLALISAPFEPLVPLAAGLFADTLYYTPQAGSVPFFTLCGAALTIAAFLVRGRIRTGSIE